MSLETRDKASIMTRYRVPSRLSIDLKTCDLEPRMTLCGHFMFNSICCHVEVRDLLTYLYGQCRDDIYGRGIYACRSTRHRSTRHSEKAVMICSHVFGCHVTNRV